jgi:hypothetical protein
MSKPGPPRRSTSGGARPSTLCAHLEPCLWVSIGSVIVNRRSESQAMVQGGEMSSGGWGHGQPWLLSHNVSLAPSRRLRACRIAATQKRERRRGPAATRSVLTAQSEGSGAHPKDILKLSMLCRRRRGDGVWAATPSPAARRTPPHRLDLPLADKRLMKTMMQ